MAYTPSLADLEPTSNSGGGYSPSLDDLEEKDSGPDLFGFMSHPIRNTMKGVHAAQDVAGGVMGGAQRLASFIGEAAEYPTHAAYEKITGNKVPHFPVREFMGLEGENPVDLRKMISHNPDSAMSTIGGILPALAGGGMSIPKQVAAQGLWGITQADPGQTNAMGYMPEGRIGAGATDALATFIAGGLGKLAPKAIPAAKSLIEKFQPGKQAEDILSKLGQGAKNLEENTANLTSDIRKAHDARVAESTIYSDFVKKQAGNGKLYDKPNPLISMKLDKEKQVLNEMEDLNVGPLFDKFKHNPTFNNAHDLQSELGVMMGQLERQPQTIATMREMGDLKKIRDTLKADMHTYLGKVGDELGQDLSGMYKRSSDFYRDNVVPYLSSKKLRDITRGGQTQVKNAHQIFESPTDYVNRFTGKTETGPINKILEDLPEETAGRIMFGKLGANSKIGNPKKLAEAIVNADQKGFSKYMTPDLKKGLEELLARQSRLNKAKWAGGLAGIGSAEELIRRSL